MKSAEKPKVYPIILNWNSCKDTVQCLESLLKCDYGLIHPIICDNDSSDGSIEFIEQWANSYPEEDDLSNQLAIKNRRTGLKYNTVNIGTTDRLNDEATFTLIQTGSNLGYAGGNNVGIQYALEQGDCDYVWILNPDTIVAPNALRIMVEHSQGLLFRGIKNTCGSMLCFYDEPDTLQALGGGTFNRWTGIAHDAQGKYQSRHDIFDHAEVCKKLDYLTGCSLLVPRNFIEEIGLMEEGYFLYYEEADWAQRSSGRYELTYAPGAIVYHKVGASIGSRKLKSGPSVQADYFMSRSRKIFMKKFFPRRYIFVWASLILQAANRLRQGKPKNAYAIFKATLGLKEGKYLQITPREPNLKRKSLEA